MYNKNNYNTWIGEQIVILKIEQNLLSLFTFSKHFSYAGVRVSPDASGSNMREIRKSETIGGGK